MKYGKRVAVLARFAMTSAVGMFLAVGVALAATPTQFVVFGDNLAPRAFTFADLSGLPSVTKDVTFQAGSTTVNTQFTGVDLYFLLNDVVKLNLDNSIKNPVLRKFVVATGSDGYEAIVSLGEIHPNFGGQHDLVAYLENGLPIGADGFARLVVPGDKRGGRYVSNLVSLFVGDVGVTPAAPAVVPEPTSGVLVAGGLLVLGVWRWAKSRRV